MWINVNKRLFVPELNYLFEFKVHKGGMQARGDSNFIELEKLQIVWSCSWHVSIGNFLDIQCQNVLRLLKPKV